MDEHRNAAAAGPKILNIDGTFQSGGGCFPSIISSLLILFRINKITSEKFRIKMFPRIYRGMGSISKVDMVLGCCLLMRAASLKKIGLLSEEYFFYHEESDWCFKAKKNNYEIWYVPSAEEFLEVG